MENDIIDGLNDLGYEGPLNDEAAFAKALDGGPKSLEYTKLVHILAEELKKLCKLEETVSMMDNPDESSSFLLELSSFLKEIGCPYKKLITGHMSSRLQTHEDRLLLLDYLISELMAARMVSVDCPKEKPGMDIVMQESPTAKDLKDILITLKFNKPPPNITPEVLFNKLEIKLRETIQKEGETLVGKPLYNKALTDKDWKNLETIYNEMYREYKCRRETLITRLECTIQSCEWSDRLKSKKDTIQSVYRPKKDHLKVKPDILLSDFLAARTSLLQVEKTSSASVRKNTQSDVNKVLIGRVPDRGGRPNEQQPPPPEMPSWQQRSAPQGGGRGGRGGGGGRGSGRGGGRGGFSQGQGHQGQGQDYQGQGQGNQDQGQGQGGYRGGRGGRVQGGYNQGADQRAQSQQRNYQTYEVPPGGYSQNNYSNQNYNQYQQQTYQSQGGGGYTSGYQSNQGSQGYQSGYSRYQNEHDDRTDNRRGRGGYQRR
ncbi:protein FAM98A isoform X2 [Aricia agestis]|uniref:protein FAM98A isoform X2 n=1 Tax=Aricia agestis TaxID=91739 RepID=UPI001C203F98|nr:protein FAM98A isoform X2 [Aricia agestis]